MFFPIQFYKFWPFYKHLNTSLLQSCAQKYTRNTVELQYNIQNPYMLTNHRCHWLRSERSNSKERSLKIELILHCFIERSIPILLRTIEWNLCHGAFSSVFHSSRRLQGKNKAPQVRRSRALGAGAYQNYNCARAVLLVQLRRFLRPVWSKPSSA
jgi:hypothetical protein